MIVVDASVAAKWMLEEPDSLIALDLLANPNEQLIAPDLILIEVASAIIRRANMQQLSPDDAAIALKKWETIIGSGALQPHSTTLERVSDGARIALAMRHPLKDCIYLALAIELGCLLATCDAKFLTKAVALYPEINLLHDFKPASGDVFTPEAEA